VRTALAGAASTRFPLSAALALLREVKERSDLAGLVSEPDRKVDEPSNFKRRGGEVNRSVSPLATSRFSLLRSFVRMTHLYLPFLRLFLMNL
jgi:hypothetical protein